MVISAWSPQLLCTFVATCGSMGRTAFKMEISVQVALLPAFTCTYYRLAYYGLIRWGMVPGLG